jgi:hypothetical protein
MAADGADIGSISSGGQHLLMVDRDWGWLDLMV